MKRKQWFAFAIVLLLGVGLWVLYQQVAGINRDLSTLTGTELLDAVRVKSTLDSAEINDLQMRGEWEAVVLALNESKFNPSAEQFALAVTEGTLEVVDAYLEQGVSAFELVNGEPAIAPVFSANEDSAQWQGVLESIKDERLLRLAVDALNLEATKRLLAQGYTVPESERTDILFQPIRHNQVELTQLLLDHGAVWSPVHDETARAYGSDLILNMQR